MLLDPPIVAPHDGGSRPSKARTWQLVLALLAAICVAEAAAQTLPRRDLAQCIEIALQQHPDLKAAAATVDAGHARTWEAISTALPQVNADYNANRRMSSVSARTGGPGGGPQGQIGTQSQTFTFYSTGFTLSQILFGTDYPYGAGCVDQVQRVADCGFSAEELAAVDRTNAL